MSADEVRQKKTSKVGLLRTVNKSDFASICEKWHHFVPVLVDWTQCNLSNSATQDDVTGWKHTGLVQMTTGLICDYYVAS